MHKVILLPLTVLALVAGQSAHAVGLHDCSKGTTETRLACMQTNTILLNSSYQTVAGELRKAVGDLQTRIIDLNKKLTDLNKKVDEIKTPPLPDLSGFVRRDQPLRLGFDQNRCLSYATGVSGAVVGPNPPIQAQLLMLLQDCSGSPALTIR